MAGVKKLAIGTRCHNSVAVIMTLLGSEIPIKQTVMSVHWSGCIYDVWPHRLQGRKTPTIKCIICCTVLLSDGFSYMLRSKSDGGEGGAVSWFLCAVNVYSAG